MAEERARPRSELASARYEIPYAPDRFNRTTLLLEWVGRDKDVLELGCSTGYISRLLLAQGCRVTGVENDPNAAAMAAACCERVVTADLNSSDWSSDLAGGPGFDVVVLGDVIEHLVRPEQVMFQIRPLLKPGGYVVISLPNVVHWQTRLKLMRGRFDYEPTGTLDVTHLRFFTPRTAQAFLEGAGYKVLAFHPAIGGRMSGHFRPAWQLLAHMMPGLFAFQVLFRATPQ